MNDERGPVRVTDAVLAGLEAVRASGVTNMFARDAVAKYAKKFGHPEAAEWVRNHRDLYAAGVFRGFEAGDQP